MAEGDNLSEFLNVFEKNVSELKNAEEEMTEDNKLNQLCLPESYAHIVDIIHALPAKNKSVEYVKSKLLLNYKKRKIWNLKR